MSLNKILGVVAVGGLIYAAYRYGLNEGKKNLTETNPDLHKDEVTSEKSEIDCINEIIQSIQSKPNKNTKDRDTIELLKLKLKQLTK